MDTLILSATAVAPSSQTARPAAGRFTAAEGEKAAEGPFSQLLGKARQRYDAPPGREPGPAQGVSAGAASRSGDAAGPAAPGQGLPGAGNSLPPADSGTGETPADDGEGADLVVVLDALMDSDGSTDAALPQGGDMAVPLPPVEAATAGLPTASPVMPVTTEAATGTNGEEDALPGSLGTQAGVARPLSLSAGQRGGLPGAEAGDASGTPGRALPAASMAMPTDAGSTAEVPEVSVARLADLAIDTAEGSSRVPVSTALASADGADLPPGLATQSHSLMATGTTGGASELAQARTTTTLAGTAHPLGEQFAGELAVHLRAVARGNGVQEATLQLHPAELGRLHITLSTDGDQARVLFVADNVATRDAIEASLPRLRELLAQSGLNLADAGVGGQQSQGRDSQGLPAEPDSGTALAPDIVA
ncbi:MAG: flagellar hook-length control protein FliK, partial [Parahaliea sp.]